MAQGDNYFDCDGKKVPGGWDQFYNELIIEDENGNPCLKVCAEVSGSGGGGLATEAKQDAMIVELMKGSDFELSCVQDTVTGVHYLLRVYRLETDGSIVTDYIDATGAVVVPPNPGDLVVCNPSAALAAILSEIQATNVLLQEIEDNTDGLEGIAQSSLVELQAINLNTDTLEALVSAGNLDLAAISSTLSGQTALLNAIITILSNINNAVNTSDLNNVTELQAIQAQLVTVIADLGAIDGNTAPLEASLTAIETAINTQGGLQVAELTAIKTNTLNTVTELQAANATLVLLNGQFSGTPSIVRADISGQAAYVIPAGTYNSIQIYIKSGTVSDGTIPHETGLFVETVPIKGATHPGMTLDASAVGTVAFVKLMTN